MSVDPQDLRHLIYNVALARRRVHEIMTSGSLASLEFEYELAFAKQVLVTVHSRLREVYTDGFEGTTIRLDPPVEPA